MSQTCKEAHTMDEYICLFIVHKREVIQCSAGTNVGRIRGAFVVDMFDKFEGFFVSVDEGEGIILWIYCQKLPRGRNQGNDIH